MRVVLTLLSVIGIGLTLLGFGSAISLASVFGLDIGSVLHGPVDYLSASAYPIAQATSKLFDPRTMDRLVDALLSYAGVVAIFAAVAASVIFLINDNRSQGTRQLRLVRRLLRAYGRRFWAWRGYWRVPVSASAAGLGGPLLVWSLAKLALVPLVFLVLPTILGFRLADAYFYSSVIEPIQCIQPTSAIRHRERHLTRLTTPTDPPQERDEPLYAASCVEVATKDHGPIKGRRVIETSDVIVLYDPATGTVRRVPLKDAIVTSIGKL